MLRRNIASPPNSRWERKSPGQPDLDQCLKLSVFPNILGTLSILVKLLLGRTAIETLPNSIWKMKSLEYLSNHGCSPFAIFPEVMKPMPIPFILDLERTAVETLDGCSRFANFPEVVEPMPNLFGCSRLSLGQSDLAEAATGLLEDVTDAAWTPNPYTALEIEPADLEIYDDDESSLIDDVYWSRKPKHGCIGWVLPVINIILEALSAYFDQVSSPKMPRYALLAMLMAFVAVAMSTIELNHKTRKAHVILRRRDCAFIDIFGLICAIFQCIFSIIQYVYHIQHADSPIKISVLPLIFAICAAGSRFFSQRELEPLPHGYIP